MIPGRQEEGSLKRFMKTKWFRVLYVSLIALASSVVMISTGCLSAFFIPLLMFAIPYYLKERNIRRYLINGVVVLLLCLVLVNVFRTTLIVTSPEPDVSVQQGNVTLSSGTVDPYQGPAGSNYSFSIVYTNAYPVDPSGVALTLEIFNYLTVGTQTYAMDRMATSEPATSGWTFMKNLTLSEGVYFFNFTAKTGSGSNAEEVVTPFGFGPLNAPWTTYASALAFLVVIDMLFPFTLYLIIIGMYWWTGRAKMMRGPARLPQDRGGGGFECTNCGAEVSERATRCHRCGAIFEEEEEPVIKAKKVEKGVEGKVEKTKSDSWKETRK